LNHSCPTICLCNLAMNKIMVAMSDEMVKALEGERKARKLESIPETVRAVLGEYFKRRTEAQ